MSETTVTLEEEKEAIRLGLPPKFFAYKQLTDCTCDQCKKDDIYLKELFEDKSQKNIFSAQQNAISSPANIFASTTYKTPTTASSGTIQQLLVKPSVFGNLNLSQNKSQAAPVTTETSNAFKTFTFTINQSQTTTNTTDSNKSIFGNAFGTKTPPVFGTPATTTTASSIFGLATSTFSTPATTTTTSFFGSKPGLFSTSQTSLFGGGALTQSGGSIFGTASANINDSKPTFGTNSTFGSAKTTAPSDSINTSTVKEVILPSDPNLTFASLAASSQNKPAFGKKTGKILII